MKTYNKLVRDKIPAIITAQGQTCTTHTLGDEEYLHALIAKLSEECAEFAESQSIQELADVQEVILALADMVASRPELEQTRVAKCAERGAFTQKIFLESVS